MTELRFPNFLIIGAMRAGTTTLYRDLLTHPDVFFPSYKEPGHLASERVLTEAGRAEYAALFAAARPHDLCGEASTNSTKLPDFSGVPRRAHKLMGSQLKLVYVVREPVSRTLSHHRYEYSLGYLPRRIEDALETHAKLTDYSRYAMQLKAWLEYFDADQIHVIRFEDFVRQRQRLVEECFQFLGLPPTSTRVESGRVYNARDEIRIPRSGWLKTIQKHPLYHRFVRPFLPIGVKDSLWNMFRQKDLPKPPPASLAAVNRIVDAVVDDAAELQLLLGRDEPLWDLDAVVAGFRDKMESHETLHIVPIESLGPTKDLHLPEEDKPVVAIVLTGVTPYHFNFCRQLTFEIPEIAFHSVFLYDQKLWLTPFPPEINAIYFGDTRENEGRSWAGIRLGHWRTATRVFEHFKTNGTSAVLLSGYASLLHLRLIALCHRHSMPLFLSGDSNIKGDLPRGLIRDWTKRCVLKWVLDRCCGVMPMGELGIRYFEKYGADPDRIYLVPYGPDFEFFRYVDPEELDEFRQRHGLSADRRYVVTCCRLIELKRIDLLIDAFAEVAQKRPDWDLLIIGDGPLRAQLTAQVPADLSDRVRWLGFCQPEEVRSALHTADVFVLPSSYEAWGVVIGEAAAVGLVTVASDVVGATKELVKDHVNGRLFTSGSKEELIETLLDVTQPDVYRRYQEQVRPVLEEWRKRSDPVNGVRQALRAVNVL